MKKFFKSFFHKKENVAITALALVLCAGVAVSNVKSGSIPLHDGDVLVDSRSVAQAEESSEIEEETAAAEIGESTAQEESSGAGTFDEKRASLELQRSELIAKYDDTIKNSTSEAEQKNALEQKEKLSGYMEQEVAVENLIKSKNLPDSMVIITESTVTVTVDEQDLNQNTVAKICSVVMTETGRTADKIVIQSNY